MSPLRYNNNVVSKTMSLVVALGIASTAHAQTSPSGSNLSTGSGAGTSPGTSPGSSPSATQIGTGGLRSPQPTRPAQAGTPRGTGPATAVNPSRPGGDLRPTPGDPTGPQGANGTGGLISDPDNPLGGGIIGDPLNGGQALSQDELDAIDLRILNDARQVIEPSARATAMERVARAKIVSHRPSDSRLDESQIALQEASQAAALIQDEVTRDLRYLNIVRTAMSLADELAREGIIDSRDTQSGAVNLTNKERLNWLVQAENERLFAARNASAISSTNLGSEMLYRVVDSIAQGSQTLAEKALTSEGQRSDLKGVEPLINRIADRLLVIAANEAARIRKPIWRDRAMVSIAIASSASDQFDRGIEICRTIQEPEYRADAMMRLAEAQSRRNLKNQSTQTYTEAAVAVSSIGQEDPRATLASVLIDSLISVGRFEDARKSIGLLGTRERQRNALGVIAENMGERRLDREALAWIQAEAPAEDQDYFRRRVNDGLLKAFERGRNTQGQFDYRSPRR